MGGVGHRHVVRELERLEPALLAIHHRGAKPFALKFARVVVDALRSREELRLVRAQLAIVIQVVQVYFEAARPERRGGLLPGVLVTFGNELKGRRDAVRLVDLAQLLTEVEAGAPFDVVRHHRGCAGAVWPEPDEWKTRTGHRLEQ